MYTLLVPVIIFAVYIFFLRELELSAVRNTLHDLGIAADASLTKYLQTLVDSWMLSGIAALSTITVSLQTNTVFVEDKQNGVNRDFVSSPINKNVLIGSYTGINQRIYRRSCCKIQPYPKPFPPKRIKVFIGISNKAVQTTGGGNANTNLQPVRKFYIRIRCISIQCDRFSIRNFNSFGIGC